MTDTVRPPYSAKTALPDVDIPSPTPGRASVADIKPSSLSNPDDALSLPRVCPTCGVRYPPEFKVCPRDATELQDTETVETDELIGTTINQTYNIVRAIGEGGMGRVYEARHQRIGGKRFAIKMLHPEFARKPDVLSRFQREAEAAASIQSQHVVEVYDVHRTPDGRPFLVAEFLEGIELADQLIAQGKMSIAGAVRITRQLCSAMQAAHGLGIVHRDLKPENVFLTGDLQRPIAKVIDFGISKTGDQPGTQLTKTGMIMGTPSFMAPEQAKGEKVSHLVDVYAVGAILYNMVTGQRPFDRNDPTATLTAVLVEDPPRPRSLNPHIPDSLEAVIQRAMAKESSERYATMAELDEALTPFADKNSPSMRPPPSANAAMTHGRSPMSSMLDRGDHAAGLARPQIVLMTSLGVFVAVGGVLTMVAALVRLARGGGVKANLTGAEAAVLVAIVVVALIAPIILVARHYRTAVWGNSARAVDFAARLRGPVLVSLAAYGFGSLLVRVVETVFLRRAVGAAWPMWDLLMLLIGGMAVAGFYLAPILEKRSRTQ